MSGTDLDSSDDKLQYRGMLAVHQIVHDRGTAVGADRGTLAINPHGIDDQMHDHLRIVVRCVPGLAQLLAEQAIAGRKGIAQLVAAASDLRRTAVHVRMLADAVYNLNHMSVPSVMNALRPITPDVRRDLPRLQDVAKQLSCTRTPRRR
ncbi:hypothetical protein [Streptomyces noursei]